MPRSETKSLSTEALLTLFTGLALIGCQKSTPEVSAELTQAATSAKGAGSSQPPAASAREVPAAAGSAKAEKEGGCAPGGCAPGKCAANKNE